MQLTLIPKMWNTIGPPGRPEIFQEKNVTRYEVAGLPGDDRVYLQVETTAQHRGEWRIKRNGVKSSEVRDTAEAAKEALETGTA